ncbi:hypothetical protein GCM10009616_22330 [Microlunatus lacustris]
MRTRRRTTRIGAQGWGDAAVGVVFGLLAASNLVQGIWLRAVPWLDLTTASFAVALPVALLGVLRRTTIQQIGVVLLLFAALILGYLTPALTANAENKRINLLLGVAFVFVASFLSLTNARRLRAFLVTIAALALPVVIGQALLADPAALMTGRRTPVGVNAIGAGRELGSALILLLALLGSGHRRYRSVLVLLALVLGAGLYLAGSRGPVAGVLAALVVLILTHPTWRRRTQVALLAALLLLGALIYSRSTLTSSRLADATSSGRREIYASALRIAGERPMGIGWGNFARFAPAEQLRTAQGDNLYVHNIVLEFWIEAGIAGALAFSFFLIVIVIRALRAASISPLRYALSALTVNLLVGAMLSSDVVGNRMLWVVLAAVLAGAASRDVGSRTVPASRSHQRTSGRRVPRL